MMVAATTAQEIRLPVSHVPPAALGYTAARRSMYRAQIPTEPQHTRDSGSIARISRDAPCGGAANHLWHPIRE
jgi:hypothetical protein